jgi:hypothetical protein
MRRCPPIADHGMVGDLQTAALVSSEGVVDWICAPRFDSPSLFAALPDHDRGGHFAITVDGTDVTTRQPYPAGTAVLITRCLTPPFQAVDEFPRRRGGVGRLLERRPVTGAGAAGPPPVGPRLKVDRERAARDRVVGAESRPPAVPAAVGSALPG